MTKVVDTVVVVVAHEMIGAEGLAIVPMVKTNETQLKLLWLALSGNNLLQNKYKPSLGRANSINR